MRLRIRSEAQRLACRRLIKAMIARDQAKSEWAKEYWSKIAAHFRAQLV